MCWFAEKNQLSKQKIIILENITMQNIVKGESSLMQSIKNIEDGPSGDIKMFSKKNERLET